MNPWERYCNHINQIENISINNIDEVYNHWNSFTRIESLKKRKKFFDELAKNIIKEYTDYDEDILGYNGGYNLYDDDDDDDDDYHHHIYRIITVAHYNGYNKIGIVEEIFIINTKSLINLIKFRCFCAKSLNYKDINDKFSQYILWGEENYVSYHDDNFTELINYNFHTDTYFNNIFDVEEGDIKLIDFLGYTMINSKKQCLIHEDTFIYNKPNLINYINSLNSFNYSSCTTTINRFTKIIHSRKIKYDYLDDYLDEYIYDYEQIKDTRKDLHTEFNIVYKYIKKNLDRLYLPEAIIVNTK